MKGVDLSTYQRNVNYLELKASGIDFAIIRCGYGKNESQKDNMFEQHYAGLKYAGIKVGAYLYSYASTVEGARLEAENCLKFIKDKQFDLPIFYDLEDEKYTGVASKETITQMAIVFCETIIKNGYQAGIYANLNWFNNKMYVDRLLNYNIWLAQWSDKPTANFRVDIWQYTSKGRINAIIGNVDMDISYKDYTQPVENPVDNKIYFDIGKTYTTQVDLNVRTGAGTDYRIKKFSELTKDGQKHAYNQQNAVLKKGTRVTCLGVYIVDNEIWLKIPSGFICGYYKGKEYIK